MLPGNFLNGFGLSVTAVATSFSIFVQNRNSLSRVCLLVRGHQGLGLVWMGNESRRMDAGGVEGCELVPPCVHYPFLVVIVHVVNVFYIWYTGWEYILYNEGQVTRSDQGESLALLIQQAQETQQFSFPLFLLEINSSVQCCCLLFLLD